MTNSQFRLGILVEALPLREIHCKILAKMDDSEILQSKALD